jgi:peptide/nickel transport system substrate-binding protein
LLCMGWLPSQARYINPNRHVHWKALFLVLLCILTACNTAPSVPKAVHPSAKPPVSSYAYTPAPTHGPQGELTFADREFPDTANPLFASSNIDLTIDSMLWGQPVFYDQQFHVHPDQLTEVPLPENGGVVDGGKTIIMHLRHDLRWSDGQPIVAQDFQYWWSLNQDRDTGATITSGYDQIASIDTPDRFTVILHMKQLFGPYLFYLPYAAPQHAWQHLLPIQLQNILSVSIAPTVTSGPYKLTQMTRGLQYTLVPNTYYVSSSFHGPFLSRLTYRALNSVTTLSEAARQGQDVVTQGYMEYDLPTLRHISPGVHVLQESTAAYEHLDFNMMQPSFQNLNVRKAIQMALDVCGIIKTVLHTSDCSRRTTQVEPPPSLFYDSSIQPSVYNPSAARALLAQSGWHLTTSAGASGSTSTILMKDGRPFIVRLVTTRDNPLRAATAREIQKALRTIGIEVQIAYYSLNDFFGIYTKGGILATGAYDMALFTYANSPEPDDEYDVFHSSQIPDAAHPDLGNYGRINDPLIDQALAQGRTTVDFAHRVVAYHSFLERLTNQVYMFPLYREVNIMTVSQRVHNVVPNANQAINTWNISDWWVSS